MAILNGANYTKAYVQTVPQKVPAGVASGKVRVVYDEIDLSAGLGVGDEIYMGKLQKGARVVDVILCFPDLGTTGVVDVGYKYEDTNLVSDDNAFLDDVDVATAGDTIRMSDQVNMVGFMKEMEGNAIISIKAQTATTATAGKIRMVVEYTVE